MKSLHAEVYILIFNFPKRNPGIRVMDPKSQTQSMFIQYLVREHFILDHLSANLEYAESNR